MSYIKLMWILIICVILQIKGLDCELQLQYYEDKELVISGTTVVEGSYANLGIYPHWCLGDIQQCQNGVMKVSFLFRSKPRSDDAPEIVVLTTGGHTHFSNGLYLIQRYGNQFEFGVSKGPKLWRVRFSLLPDLWVPIHASWNETTGLKVTVDNDVITDNEEETRDYEDGVFDLFTEIVIGLDEKGDPLRDESLFDVKDIVFYDGESGDIPVGNAGIVGFIGCKSFTDSIGAVTDMSQMTSPARSCRQHCQSEKKPSSALSEDNLCSCLDDSHDISSITESQCDGSNNVWRVFRSTCLSNENSFILCVKVTPLQTRAYTKPNETVLVVIETNVKSSVEYRIDYGDGSSTVSPDKTIGYSWKTAGTYTITVSTTVGTTALTDQTKFTVEDIDEGTKPELVVLSSYHAKAQMTGNFSLEVFDEAETKCFVDLNDGSQLLSFESWTNYFGDKDFDHKYSSFGQFEVSSKCDNKYGTASNTTTFLSRKFDIPFQYHSLADSVTVDVSGGRSFVNQLKVTRLPESDSINPIISRETSGIVIQPSSFLPFENMFVVEFDNEIILRRRFHSQSNFEKASIAPSLKSNAWSLLTNVSIDVPVGNNLFLNVSLGVDDDRLLYVYETDELATVTFEVDYSNLGYYPVDVTTSNDLMKNAESDRISVEVPIESILIRSQNITDKTQPVRLIVDLNVGQQGPNEVEFIIDRNDGNTETVHYRSHTHNFTTFINNYVYKDWGIYKICVTAKNTISHRSSCTLVQVGQNLTHVDLQTSTMSRMTTRDYAEFNLTSDTGSDNTYQVSFGDGQTFTFTDVQLSSGSVESFEAGYKDDDFNSSSTDTDEQDANVPSTTIVSIIFDTLTGFTTEKSPLVTEDPTKRKKRNADEKPFSIATRLTEDVIKIRRRYSRTGKFHVSARVFNTFTSRRADLCPSFVVDNTDTSQCDEPTVELQNRPTSFERPYVNIRSREFNITVNADSNCGVGNDYSYSWKATNFFEGRERPITEVCLDENPSNVFIFPALLLEYGKYKIDVTVAAVGYPLKSSQRSFFLEVVPSYPYAIISGEEETSFLVYGSVSFNFGASRDPDLVNNNKQGLKYDLFCSIRDDFDEIKNNTLAVLSRKSNLLYTAEITQDNQVVPFKLYEYGSCFKDAVELTQNISLTKGIFSYPAEAMIDSVADFTFRLFVTKQGRSNSTYQHVKIKLTNSSNTDDMLNALDNIQDAAGMLRAIASIKDDILGGGSNSTEANEAATEAKEKMLGSLDRVSDTTNSIGEVNNLNVLVTDLTSDPEQNSPAARSSSGSAVEKSIFTMKAKFGGEGIDTVTGVASNALKGISNLLPKEEKGEVERKRRRKKREVLENPLPGVGVQTEMDLYDRILEEEDMYHNKYIDEFYEYIFLFPKAFRDAVRKYNKLMWLPMEVLKWKKEDVFRKYSVEWEPFDIDEYINFYCRIEKKRLDNERLNADRNVAGSSGGAIDSMGGLILGKMEASRRRRKRRSLAGNGTAPDPDDNGEDVDQAVAIKADNLELQLENIDPDSDATEKTMGSDKGGIKLPTSALPKSADGCGVGTSLTVNNDNPYTYVEQPPKASVVSLDFVDPCNPDGGKLPSSNSSEPMEISITGDPDGMVSPAEFVLCVTRGDSITDASKWNYHSVTLDANDTTIHFLIYPERPEDRLMVYMKYEGYPNATHYDYKTTIPHEIEDFPTPVPNDPILFADMRHAFFPPQELTAINGTYKIGVGLAKTEVEFDKATTCLNYTTQTLITSCKILNPETEKFENRGCLVANTTTKWRTQCICYPEPPEPETTTTTMAPTTEETPFVRNSKKTRVPTKTSFGGDFVAPPNTIDFANVWAKFKNLSENAAVFATVITLILLYIVLLIWSRHEDKKDLIKWGASPLEDNLPSDNYHYQVTVNTGSKKKAGTKSKVSFILSGENFDTGVRRMYDGRREEFARGSIMNFILSVENPLGPLTFMRIWHDNSGKGKLKSWFLEQVMVADLQTGERFIFLCGRWLALEEDDGMVDRILPVAGLEELAAFKQLFNSNIKKKITSDHLWFSVFSRPTKSNFTRAQRISCCMSLLFMTMITNAMWFKGENDDKTDNSQTLKFGPVSFSMQQLFISFASTMLVFPVNFILMTFFRKCRPKKNTIMQTNQLMPKRGKWKAVNGSQIFGKAAKRGIFKKFKDSVSDILSFHQRKKYGATDDDPAEDDKPVAKIAGVPEDEKALKKRKKKKSSLPHWCIYIAWGLSWLSIVTAGFFTILYSMQWGKEKANEWLITFLMSFFQSVIVVQPVKVICIVAFIACILKKPEIDEEDTNEDLNNVIAAHDEEFLNKDSRTIDDIAERRKKANSDFQPPDPATLEEARKQRMLEIEMEMVIREIIVYLFFVLILFFLSYQQRDSDSFIFAENLKTTFDNGFENIRTADQYWVWLENKLLPSLYATNYANGSQVRKWWEKRCISDMESRRVGIPRLRQLRIKPDTCIVNPYLQSLIFHCRDEYGWSDDDTKPYLPGWEKPPLENITALKEAENPTPWVYQTSVKLRNAPYMATISTYKGGGYTVMFERDYIRTQKLMESLKNEIWLDEHTRGVFLEFTVYNPNINLFGSIIMVVEFMSSGGAVARKEVKVFRLLSYVGGLGILVLIFEVIYALFTFYFFIRCIRKVKKERLKYFKSFWDILEFVLLIFAVSVVAMYAFKQILTSVALNALKDAEKADYVNFQSLALYDEMFGWMCAFVVFLATIQFLKLLQFNKKMAMLGDTVKLASKDLKVFAVAFLLYFFTFTMTAYLLFNTSMVSYSNFVGSSEAMFAFSLGSFDFVAMSNAQPVLGPIFFFLFIGVIYIGMMSIFLTIIADAFTTVKEELANSRNEYEIVDYMMKRLKGIMGFAQNS